MRNSDLTKKKKKTTYSDDEGEGEAIAWAVKNYHFEDDAEEPICFSVLPIQWSERKKPETTTKQKVFLHGIADGGLKKIYVHVIAWKLELSYDQPEISVLSKDNIWIKLLKPRKSFENTIRGILITVHYLHFLKKNPQTSGQTLWDHLRKVFSSYGVKPSESDLLDHLALIRASVKHHRTLAKSKVLLTFVENPRKRKPLSEDICTGLVEKKTKVTVQDGCDSSDEMESADEDDSDEHTDPFDTACCMCDNGGALLVCEGRCFRSFHATVDSGVESNCKSLGLSNVQVEAIQKFLCLNCQYKQHQCYACGKLGSSDKSSGTEVFHCGFATCGHFYHPKCAAELLHSGNEVKVKQLQKKIAAGESFTCPVHKCLVCKQGENQEDKELQFAVCRRCPRAYHRKCLPRKIAFEDSEAEGIIQRAWDDLLPNRILIYCLKHKIEKNIATPARDHIIFPDVEKHKKTPVKSILGEVVTKKRVLPEESRGNIAESTPKQVRRCVAIKGNVTREREKQIYGQGLNSSEKMDLKGSSEKPVKDNIKSVNMSAIKGNVTREREKQISGQGLNSSEKMDLKGSSEKPVKDNIKSVNMSAKKSCPADARNVSLREEKLDPMVNKGSTIFRSKKQKNLPTCKIKKTITPPPITKKSFSSPHILDAEAEKRVLAIMKQTAASITLKDIIGKQRVPSKNTLTENVVRTATENVEEGSFLDEVKAVSEPDTVNHQVVITATESLEEGSFLEKVKAVSEPDTVNHQVVITATESLEEGSFLEKVKAVSEPDTVNHQVVITATESLEEGSFLEKVKAVSEPETINQIIHWKVAEKLHCFVKNGDTIIDICRGTNEFTSLMKQKLEETGKKCSFKHYGVQNGESENGDWMSVDRKELPTGSQLIMVLNLHFEAEAVVLDKFIRKVLEFKPKLLILIILEETERLGEKDIAYDLVWENNEKLSDKPNSPRYMDTTDEQMKQWSLKPPLLYFWSRPDWTANHKKIAQRRKHMSKKHRDSHLEENHKETEALIDSRNGNISNQINDLSEQHKSEPEQSLAPQHNTGTNQSDHEDDVDKEGQGVTGFMKQKPVEASMDRQNKQKSMGTGKTSQEGIDSFDNKTGDKSLPVPSEAQTRPSQEGGGEEVVGQLQLVRSGSGLGGPLQGHVKDDGGSCSSTHHSKELEKFRREADGSQGPDCSSQRHQGSSVKTLSDGKSHPRPISSTMSVGFAPGLLRPLSDQYKSGGWLDE